VQVVGRVVDEEPETEVEEATCTGAESVEVLKMDGVGKTVVNCESERCDVNVAAELEVMSGHGSDVEIVKSGSWDMDLPLKLGVVVAKRLTDVETLPSVVTVTKVAISEFVVDSVASEMNVDEVVNVL